MFFSPGLPIYRYVFNGMACCLHTGAVMYVCMVGGFTGTNISETECQSLMNTYRCSMFIIRFQLLCLLHKIHSNIKLSILFFSLFYFCNIIFVLKVMAMNKWKWMSLFCAAVGLCIAQWIIEYGGMVLSPFCYGYPGTGPLRRQGIPFQNYPAQHYCTVHTAQPIHAALSNWDGPIIYLSFNPLSTEGAESELTVLVVVLLSSQSLAWLARIWATCSREKWVPWALLR